MKRIGHQHIFLLDAVGALVSAYMLGIVLIELQAWVGMPTSALYLLASIACLFLAYSTVIHLIRPVKWRPFLRIIAYGNLSYCGITLILVVRNYDKLTAIGLTYFVLEMMIIIGLSRYELRIAQSKSS